MSIQEHLNKIRNAIKGSEVRESIAKGIETAYDDASEKDNANMEVKIARGTHPNLRSRLEEVDSKQQQTTAQLAQTALHVNNYPSVVDTLTAVPTKGGRVYFPSDAYTSNTNIAIKDNVEIGGAIGAKLDLGENTLIPNGDNINIHDMEFLGSAITILDSGKFINNLKINRNKFTDARIAINFAKGFKDLIIERNKITASRYGVLVNEMGVPDGNRAFGSENIRILNNDITVNDGDCIEINTPYAVVDQTPVLKGVLIEGNYLRVKDTDNNLPSAGFAIGIAGAKDVTIRGNTVQESKKEAIHVEDTSENVIVTNNILNNCKEDGVVIYYRKRFPSVESRNYIVNNNTIRQLNNKKTNHGIYIVDNGEGNHQSINIGGNTIEGFNVGIQSYDYNSNDPSYELKPIRLVDGTIIRDCNVGVKATGLFKGNISCFNVPVLAVLTPNSSIESIGSATPMVGTDLFKMTSSGIGSATINKFYFTKLSSYSAKTVSNTDFIDLPHYFKGTFEFNLQYGAIIYNAIVEGEYKDGVLTSEKLVDTPSNINSLGIKVNGTKLAFEAYSASNITNAKMNISFNGTWMMKK